MLIWLVHQARPPVGRRYCVNATFLDAAIHSQRTSSGSCDLHRSICTRVGDSVKVPDQSLEADLWPETATELRIPNITAAGRRKIDFAMKQ